MRFSFPLEESGSEYQECGILVKWHSLSWEHFTSPSSEGEDDRLVGWSTLPCSITEVTSSGRRTLINMNRKTELEKSETFYYPVCPCMGRAIVLFVSMLIYVFVDTKMSILSEVGQHMSSTCTIRVRNGKLLLASNMPHDREQPLKSSEELAFWLGAEAPRYSAGYVHLKQCLFDQLNMNTCANNSMQQRFLLKA